MAITVTTYIRTLLAWLSLCPALLAVGLETVVDPSYSESTLTAVAFRGATELGTDEATVTTLASGVVVATADIDLSGAGAGYVNVVFVDETNQPVAVVPRFEIDASGVEVDRLAYLDAAVTSRLAPTVAGRTLDVTATGAAGIDWGNVENPTATVALTNTSVDVGGYTIDGGSALQAIIIGSTLSASGVRSALGLASANLDTQLSGIESKVDTAIVDVGTLQSGFTTFSNKFGDPVDTTFSADIANIKAVADLVLEDTGTTLPGIVSGVAAQTYTKDRATPKRTWHFTPNTESATSPNTITEAASFDGEVFFDLTNALNPGAGILSITSVTVSPAGPTIGDAAKTSDQLKVAVPVSDHEAGKTYTYTITVSTTDGDNALVRKGRFVAE